MYKISVSEKAQAQFEQITQYMLSVLLSTQAASDFVDSLNKKYKQIAKEPHLYPYEQFGRSFYHKATLNKYILAFRIDEATRTVHIIAIGHSLQKRKNIVK